MDNPLIFLGCNNGNSKLVIIVGHKIKLLSPIVIIGVPLFSIVSCKHCKTQYTHTHIHTHKTQIKHIHFVSSFLFLVCYFYFACHLFLHIYVIVTFRCFLFFFFFFSFFVIFVLFFIFGSQKKSQAFLGGFSVLYYMLHR